MAFKIVENPTFTTTATILVPTDQGQVEQTVSVRFRVMPLEDLTLTLVDFLGRAVISVDGIEDEAGAPKGWTDEVRTLCLKLPFFQAGVLRAYQTALSGIKTGN